MNATRTHRSSVLAFPAHTDYACALTRPQRTGYPRAWWLAVVGSGIVALVSVALS